MHDTPVMGLPNMRASCSERRRQPWRASQLEGAAPQPSCYISKTCKTPSRSTSGVRSKGGSPFGSSNLNTIQEYGLAVQQFPTRWKRLVL
eukprot:6039301-Pyramimonas_sp.AAC.1